MVENKLKKVKENGATQKKKGEIREVDLDCVLIGSMAILMLGQKFGEIMKHVDEVNFALDGLSS